MRGGEQTKSVRPLDEFQTFIRHSAAIPIIKKVLSKKEPIMSNQVSSRKPFGLSTNIRPTQKGDVVLRWNGGEGPFCRKDVEIGLNMINEWKVITSKVSYDHGGLPDKNGMRRVLSIVDILPPGTICTETYIVVGSYANKTNARNLRDYLTTKIVRFLISQLSYSQDITKERFAFVPIQDFSEKWTDEKLYAKYKLTKDEIAFIESMIRPMELDND